MACVSGGCFNEDRQREINLDQIRKLSKEWKSGWFTDRRRRCLRNPTASAVETAPRPVLQAGDLLDAIDRARILEPEHVWEQSRRERQTAIARMIV